MNLRSYLDYCSIVIMLTKRILTPGIIAKTGKFDNKNCLHSQYVLLTSGVP